MIFKGSLTIKFNTSRDEVLDRIYVFWKLYQNGVIEFG